MTEQQTIDVSGVVDQNELQRTVNRRQHIQTELAALEGKVKGLEAKLAAAKARRDELAAPLMAELAAVTAVLEPHKDALRKESEAAHAERMKALA